MRKAVQKTGPYGVGMMVRLAHISGNVHDMVRWYQEVFDAVPAMGHPEPDYLESEDRYMTTVMISDLCVEIMAPAKPVNEQLPVGKFFTKHGSRLHSVGSQVDDPIGFARHLVDNGVHIAMPGGGHLDEMTSDVLYYFPRPRDVAGVACELGDFSMIEGEDPRTLETWSDLALRWQTHPSTLEKLAWITFGVRDLAAARDVFRDKWLTEVIEEGVRKEAGYRYFIVRFGDCLLEIAEPFEDGTHLAAEVANNGNMLYGATLAVRDLDAAAAHLARFGIGSRVVDEDTLVANPADCHNVPLSFTTRVIASDALAGNT